MSFTGADYHQAFEEACQELARENLQDAARAALVRVESVLWEAIQGVFVRISLAVASLVVLLPVYLLDLPQSLTSGLIITGTLVGLTISIYWLCRLVFSLEIGRHVRGRRFGEPF
jgi:hypothetical protein